jgi:hypothetical protein
MALSQWVPAYIIKQYFGIMNCCPIFFKPGADLEARQVPEYWIAHPVDKTMMVFRLTVNQEYGKPRIYAGEDPIPVGLFPDQVIDLKKVFKI